MRRDSAAVGPLKRKLLAFLSHFFLGYLLRDLFHSLFRNFLRSFLLGHLHVLLMHFGELLDAMGWGQCTTNPSPDKQDNELFIP